MGSVEVIFLAWLLLAAGTAAIGRRKGRSGIGWFLLGMLLGPLPFLIVLAVRGRAKCPYCAVFIKPGAIVCRSCRRDLIGASPSPPGHDRFEEEFRGWLESQQVDPESLDASQLAQLRTAFEQSKLWSPAESEKTWN